MLNSEGAFALRGDSGDYYCGRKVLSCDCCDGICGPKIGCNCESCQSLDQGAGTPVNDNNCSRQPYSTGSSQTIIGGWTWGEQPTQQQLRECLDTIVREQSGLVAGAAGTTLSAIRLRQRLTIMQRYLTALGRTATPSQETTSRKQTIVLPSRRPDNNPTAPGERAAMGLARVGSRAALSFAFAFLRRAWRSGEDQDLCSDLLRESLEALQALPEASLFDTDNVSKVWLEVVERATKFLRQVVAGDVSGHNGPAPPSEDRHLALALLCELSLQRANLSEVLSNVMLLINLWNSGNGPREDNR